MAWSYDTSLSSDKDKIRLLIGDTDELTPQLQDEEIVGSQNMFGGVRATAIQLCRALAAKYSRRADKWVGDLKIMASQQAKAYLDLAEQLMAGGGGSSGGFPTAGGIYVDDKSAQAANTSLVQPTFTTGMMGNEEE